MNNYSNSKLKGPQKLNFPKNLQLQIDSKKVDNDESCSAKKLPPMVSITNQPTSTHDSMSDDD
jgi:hypothetical protein